MPEPIPESWTEVPRTPNERSLGVVDSRQHRQYYLDELPGKVLLEDGRVEWIVCDASLNYRGVEVMGLQPDELRELVGPRLDDPDPEDVDDRLLVLRSSALGADFMLVNGRVGLVICKPITSPGC